MLINVTIFFLNIFKGIGTLLSFVPPKNIIPLNSWVEITLIAHFKISEVVSPFILLLRNIKFSFLNI